MANNGYFSIPEDVLHFFKKENMLSKDFEFDFGLIPRTIIL